MNHPHRERIKPQSGFIDYVKQTALMIHCDTNWSSLGLMPILSRWVIPSHTK